MSFFSTPQRPKHLVEFNAGKCIREGNLIKPDLRKGTVYMDQSDDQLMHFYWKERRASEPEEDLIIFPDEAEMVRVDECTTGRVYLLKFKSSNQKLFFWMQSKSDEKDEEVITRVNQLVNDPQAAVMDDSPMEFTGRGGTPGDMLQLLGGASDQISRDNILQFLQSAGGLGGSLRTSATDDDDDDEPMSPHEDSTSERDRLDPEQQQQQEQQQQSATTPASPAVNSAQLEQLRNLLAGVQTPDNHRASLSLNDVLTTETLGPVLNDPELCASLFPFLPEESERSPAEVRQVVRSPQFQQALATLSFALESGELGPLLAQLGLPVSAGNNVESFLRAIEEQARRGDQSQNHRDAMEED